MTLFVDPEALRSESNRLSGASALVDGLAASLPHTTDGGVGTAAITGLLSIFAESGGELTCALAAFADVLTESVDRYAEQDLATADEINAAWWKEPT